AHLLEHLRGERRAVAARAVEHDAALARHTRLDRRLEHAARDVHRAGDVPEVPLVRLAHVDERQILAALHRVAHLLRRDLGDALLRFGEQLGGGLHGAGDSTCNEGSSASTTARAPNGIVHCSAMWPTGTPSSAGTPNASATSRTRSASERWPSPPSWPGQSVQWPNTIAWHPVNAPASTSWRSSRSIRYSGSVTSSSTTIASSNRGAYGVPASAASMARLPP